MSVRTDVDDISIVLGSACAIADAARPVLAAVEDLSSGVGPWRCYWHAWGIRRRAGKQSGLMDSDYNDC